MGPRRSSSSRLFAEFIVIVAGVLVALAVDAAWEARSERQQERAYYGSLARDLASDTAEYRITLRMAARSIEAAEQVRSAILGEEASSSRPLSQSLIYASWVNHPSWSFGTIDELYAAGTIRLLRDLGIKEGVHAYRSLVDEWRPRLQPPELSTFLTFRQQADGLIPLEARIAYWNTRLDNEQVDDLGVDEAALARRLRGDELLLNLTERMILEWASLAALYEEQLDMARMLFTQIEPRAVEYER